MPDSASPDLPEWAHAGFEKRAVLDRLGDEIADLAVHLTAGTARLLTLIRAFDAGVGWEGFASCAHWLSWRVGLDLGAAREHVRVARALGRLPLLAEALAKGELSYAKARALTRVATPETQPELLAVAQQGTAAHVERIVRGWRHVDRRVELLEQGRHDARRMLHVYHDDDGSVVIRGRVAPEVGALFLRALEAAKEELYQRARPAEASPTDGAAERPSVPAFGAYPPIEDADRATSYQRNTDALALLAETALHHGLDPGAPGERYQVVVHVDAAVLADPAAPGQSVLEAGPRAPAETSRRLACDASRVVMRESPDGQITEIGARTRTIPPALRRALVHRDRGCRFPGCGNRLGTQGHHIRHWAEGGPTKLSNLALLCRRHHRAVHEGGYDVHRRADGALCFRRPDGREMPAVPPLPPLPPDPVAALKDRHAQAGLPLDGAALQARYLGEKLDLGYAIDVLHPAARSRPYAASGDVPAGT